MNPYGAYSQAKALVNEDDKGQILIKVLAALPEKIDLVKSLIAQKKYERKYEELTRITKIIDILNASLDMSMGEIPRSLSSLYVYVNKKLQEVHSSLDLATLDHCRLILLNLAEGFEEAYKGTNRVPLRTVDSRETGTHRVAGYIG